MADIVKKTVAETVHGAILKEIPTLSYSNAVASITQLQTQITVWPDGIGTLPRYFLVTVKEMR